MRSAMKLSKADASKLLTLKTWADASGANLKKLDAADVKQAVKATGVSAADVKRLAAASSTFTKADFAALAKQSSLAGDSASKAPIQQREVFGVGEKKSQLTEAGVAFWHSPYTNEDAKVVMKQRGLPDLRAAKDFIGHAIREGARVPFATVATALLLAGARKECDFDLLGVLEPHPRQRTLEVRCLPMSLSADDVLASLARVEALLAPLLRRRAA